MLQHRRYSRLSAPLNFVRYHMKPPEKLGEPAIKEYLQRLLKIGAGPETLKMHVERATKMLKLKKRITAHTLRRAARSTCSVQNEGPCFGR